MKTLIVFDSVQGNTEKVAKAIADAFAGEAVTRRVSSDAVSDLSAFDTLIVGSPTMGGRPTQPMQDLLARLPQESLKGKGFLTFDTRLTAGWVKIFGYAADKMAKSLAAKGGKQLAPPQGFLVVGDKGPLKEGELERAAGWIKEIKNL